MRAAIRQAFEADTASPIAQFARGEGPAGAAFDGVDYRGPGTDWALLAKIDRAELIEQTLHDAAWILASGLLALFALGTGIYLQRERQALQSALAERDQQAERLRALALLSAIADSSTDAIFAKDRQGRYLLFNQEASRVTGRTQQEVMGQDDRVLFSPDVLDWVKSAQPKAWALLTKNHGASAGELKAGDLQQGSGVVPISASARMEP